MPSETLVHGVLFRLKSAKGGLEHRSLQWWVAFLVVTGLSLFFLGTLFALALRSVSQFGLEVVGTTFVIACAMLVAYEFQKRNATISHLKRTQRRMFFALACLAACIAALPAGWLLVPDLADSFSFSAILGGLLLGAIFLLIVEATPILIVRGSPGYITEAGFLIVLSMTYMTAVSFWITPYSAIRINVGPILVGPSPAFPLGTTDLGQDLLSRVIAGGATMLQVAILSVSVCFAVGVPIALAASYKGGAADRFTSLIMDSIYAFPGLVLAIAIAAMLGPGAVNMALSIAVVYIPSYFRVIRSQTLTIKELPYVEAAVAMGARNRDILFRYILPNILPSAMVVMTINFADAILTAAGLTFVGLGLPVTTPDWGWDLTNGRNVAISGYWWVITFPGLMIVLLALGFTLAGEGLNEIITPKLKE